MFSRTDCNMVMYSVEEIKKYYNPYRVPLLGTLHNNNNNIAFFSQASWGRLEMKPERNKFKVQAH